jgi:hypothetical protein
MTDVEMQVTVIDMTRRTATKRIVCRQYRILSPFIRALDEDMPIAVREIIMQSLRAVKKNAKAK